ncbi:MAG: hypothetical protein ACE5G2_00220 [Candidatus Krumholzibacteriia bacterium]
MNFVRMSRFRKIAALAPPIVGLVAVSCLAWYTGGARRADAQSAPPQERDARAPAVANPHGEIKIRCEACHTAESWVSIRDPLEFDHAETGFHLRGRHAAAECRDCHETPLFAHVGTSCADCHRDVHEGRNGIRCQDCHSPEQWIQRAEAIRQHASTRLPLQGVHALVECSRCHAGLGEAGITGLSTDCVSCHAAQYAATRNPDHAAAGYTTRCDHCHNASSSRWESSAFDHAATGFPLTGAHRVLTCESCHKGSSFAAMSADCFSCHQTEYAATGNPNHAEAGFPTNCSACHSTTRWEGASFNHDVTRFPLTGAHRAATCTNCHEGGRYGGTPTDCYTCHQAEYAATANPSHLETGFPTDCAACHTTTRWEGATFDHAATGFPLVGAHRNAACASCHPGGRYTGTTTDCYACHQDDYAATSNPDHQASNFPTSCMSCHTPNGWSPAEYDHAATGFPLAGAHRNAACASCHPGGRYTGTPTDCYACHESDYARTGNPSHTAAGFPTDCTSCHTPNGWSPANWNHDALYFRIYSGKHRGKWDSCATCHVNASNFGDFTCFQCHKHNQTSTDDNHRDVSGYRYEPRACYDCHRDV